MSGRRLSCVHSVAEDIGPESRGPQITRNGRAVTGFATFYIPASGWTKIPPGRLDIAEIWGGASGFGGNEIVGLRQAVTAVNLPLPQTEFYINLLRPSRSFIAVNGSNADIFTLGFFGRKYS